MAVNIKLNKTYTIKTDRYNFILYDENTKDYEYYHDLSHLLGGLLSHSLRKSDAKTLIEWGRDLNRIKKDIDKVYGELLKAVHA